MFYDSLKLQLIDNLIHFQKRASALVANKINQSHEPESTRLLFNSLATRHR